MQSEAVNLDVMGANLIAQELEVSFEQLGADIFKLATWIEFRENKGFDRGYLERNQLPVYFLASRYDASWKGILFHGEGTRKRDFNGWGVRKRPHWSLIWGDRFGWDTLTGRGIVETAETEAYAEKPKQDARFERPRQSFAQGEFDGFSTVDIGHRWAMAVILYRRYDHLRWQVDRDTHDWRVLPQGYIGAVWLQQGLWMESELKWRMEYHPKETERDLAKRILDAGISYFYTRETVDKWISANTEPMFSSGDFEQPYDDKSQHAEFMSESQVRRVFVELVAGERTDIDQEDIDLVLRILKKQLSNLKGGAS